MCWVRPWGALPYLHVGREILRQLVELVELIEVVDTGREFAGEQSGGRDGRDESGGHALPIPGYRVPGVLAFSIVRIHPDDVPVAADVDACDESRQGSERPGAAGEAEDPGALGSEYKSGHRRGVEAQSCRGLSDGQRASQRHLI